METSIQHAAVHAVSDRLQGSYLVLLKGSCDRLLCGCPECTCVILDESSRSTALNQKHARDCMTGCARCAAVPSSLGLRADSRGLGNTKGWKATHFLAYAPDQNLSFRVPLHTLRRSKPGTSCRESGFQVLVNVLNHVVGPEKRGSTATASSFPIPAGTV